ncbi:MAG: hypothetical protein ABSG43_10820 [Solirubrobacteraceae bacterium]
MITNQWCTSGISGSRSISKGRRSPASTLLSAPEGGWPDQLDSVRFGHGLFSLLDAFPFQHPGAPELSVSIPAPTPPAPNAAGQTRLFGQGASGSFDNFTTLTISGDAGPANPSEIATALAAAHG